VDKELTARDELSQSWKTFSENECRGYSPLYERITKAVSENPDVLDFLLSSPLDKLHPNLLLAAVHDRVLQGLEPELFDIYYNKLSADVGAKFVDCVLRSQDEYCSDIGDSICANQRNWKSLIPCTCACIVATST